MLLNWIWLFLVLTSVLFAAWTGRMSAVSAASLENAKSAIELIIGLTGGMMFFLGLVRIASEGGLLRGIIRFLSPVLRRLFPDLPPDHPAMKSMTMNFAANILGLGNAATPFGLKAMVELNKDNPNPGSATNSMALFLANNTSSIVLLPPTGTVMVRLAAESSAPFAIWLPTLFATICSTIAAVTGCLLLQRLPFFRPRKLDLQNEIPLEEATPEIEGLDSLEDFKSYESPLKKWIAIAFMAVIVLGLSLEARDLLNTDGSKALLQAVSRDWVLPMLIATFVLIGFSGGARSYDALVAGGREGITVAMKIAPYLVAIMTAVGMFRASGALELLVSWIDPISSSLGVPAEALPMALLRPLSGSGAFGLMAEIINEHGPDSYVGYLVSTLQGSTETTFYVLAIYLGVVGIRDSRHILPACLIGDFAGLFGATLACRVFFG